MNKAYKFVSQLNESQVIELKKIMKNGQSQRVSIRAHSVLLSSKGLSIDEISYIYDIYRDSVSSWIDAWEERGIESLFDKPRSGKPSKLTVTEIETVKKIINEYPHSPKVILAKISEILKKNISISTLKRIIKKAGLRWKRVRRSTKNRRDEKEFQKIREEIDSLKQQQRDGIIDLFYSDESGFSLDSRVPYAYQPIGETLEISASKSRRLNVLGFLTTDNHFESFSFDCSINSEAAVACFNKFAEIITKKTVVIIDNSSIHHSKKFEENIEEWEKKGLFIKYLPKYSPELNLIEILWRVIKYHWLPFSAYLSFNDLVKNVEDILKNVGTIFKINFA